MQRRSVRTEFQHVAKHGDAPPARLRFPEQRNGGAHGCRIGVIALINEDEIAERKTEHPALAAPPGRCEASQIARCLGDIAAQRLDCK